MNHSRHSCSRSPPQIRTTASPNPAASTVPATTTTNATDWDGEDSSSSGSERYQDATATYAATDDEDGVDIRCDNDDDDLHSIVSSLGDPSATTSLAPTPVANRS